MLLFAFCEFTSAQVVGDPPPPLGHLVDIGSRQLHLHCLGSGLPAVIMENGQSLFSIDWALVQPHVAKLTRVCTYDRTGYAWSERGPATRSVEQTTDDLHLLLRTVGVRAPYILVGHSIGGLYVQGYQDVTRSASFYEGTSYSSTAEGQPYPADRRPR